MVSFVSKSFMKTHGEGCSNHGRVKERLNWILKICMKNQGESYANQG